MNIATRKIDELGRVVIPMDMRKKLGWAKEDEVLISIEEDEIVMTNITKEIRQEL